MNGSFPRISIVTRTLLRQNRVMIMLLLLWPCVLSGILLAASHGAPATEDVASILEQELFYGLVLVGLGSSVALSTEQRARRMQGVLGRAVGRSEYLLALGASAYLPFAGYVAVWLLNAGAFAGLLRLRTPALMPAVLAEFSAGLLLCVAGLLFSVLLSQLLAAVATGVVLAGLLAGGTRGWGGVARLFAAALGGPTLLDKLWPGAWQALAASVVLALLAVLLFERKDLKLT
jgi:hypothetical protein